MTDGRYPDRWLIDRRVLALSDAAHRLFVVSLVWSASNRTDGRIEVGDLAMLKAAPVTEEVIAELVKSGLWAEDDLSWLITVFEETQQTAAYQENLNAARIANRRRQARFRARQRETLFDLDVTRDVTPNDTGIGSSYSLTEPQDTESERQLRARARGNGAAFEAFWAAWPSGRKVGKDAARRAFARACERAAPSAIVAGARRFAADPNLPADRQFIPHPATWLNAGRWDDDPLPPRRPDDGGGVSPWEPND